MRMLLLLLAALWAVPARAQEGLHTEPVLVLEPGMHTAQIKRLDADAAGRFLVTASDDKTVRVWAAEDGALLRTLRLPAGPGNVGQARAVAISPDGALVAAGGWTGVGSGDQSVYLFDRASGRLLRRAGGLPNVVHHLAFSPDGTRLAAALGGSNGVRLIDPATGRVVAEDRDYGGASYGAAFDRAGRLATTSEDGKVRLYGSDLRLLKSVTAPGGEPYGVAFSPDGARLAVGYDDDTAAVDVLDGATLARLFAADAGGVDNGGLHEVAWSTDGAALLAAGQWPLSGDSQLRRWAGGGRGARTDLPLARDTVTGLRGLAGGRLAFAAGDPRLGMLGAGGREAWARGPATADYREQRSVLAVSADGARVAFGYEVRGRSPAAFSLAERRLAAGPAPAGLAEARTVAPGVEVRGWERGGREPTLNGVRLALDAYETSRSLAVAPDGERFALGTDWSLRLFGRDGRQLWRRAVPGVVWAVNATGDGRLLVAAYADGTIRWHRLEDGAELLALYPHADRERWVLWTPRGHYVASPGGEDLIGWQVNRGWDQAPEFYTASRFRDRFHRPDVVEFVLRELDVDKALARADAARGPTRAAEATGAPPSAGVRTPQVSLVNLPPIVTITAPEDGARVEGDMMRVSYVVEARPGSRVKQVRLLLDGRDVLAQAGFEVPAGGAVDRWLPVPLEGSAERLAIIAEGEHGSSDPATVRLRRVDPKAVRKPNLWVLAVGVSAYAHHPNLALRYAAKDAREFVEFVKRQAGGDLYGRVEAQLLPDGAATWDAIEGGLRWLEQRVEPGDVAMVFFSGHGQNDRYGNLVLLPHDADASTDAKLRRTGFHYDGLQPTLVQLAGRAKTIVFLDACYAGNVKGSTADPSQVVMDLAAEENGVIVFASASARQLSEEYERGQNGAFTEALLEGLGGGADYNKDKVIRFLELRSFVIERVTKLTDRRQLPTAVLPEKRLGDPPLLVVR